MSKHEEEFNKSWESMYDAFANFFKVEETVRTLDELKALGYNNKFRYGQSMSTLIISRSIKHGLTPEHFYLAIFAPNKTGKRNVFWQLENDVGGDAIEKDHIENTIVMDKVLKLLNCPLT